MSQTIITKVDKNKQLKMQLNELDQYGSQPLIRISGIPKFA